MNICKNCKHFYSGYCEMFEEDEKNPVGIELFVDDDSGLDIRIRVSDDFGCLLFARREK